MNVLHVFNDESFLKVKVTQGLCIADPKGWVFFFEMSGLSDFKGK